MFERYWHFPAAAALLLIVPVALLLPSTANAFSFHLTRSSLCSSTSGRRRSIVHPHARNTPATIRAFERANEMSSNQCHCTSSSTCTLSHAEKFPNTLPSSRLGRQHATLASFYEAVHGSGDDAKESLPGRKHYSLVVVTDRESPSCRRILLGMKHRGFGKGLYNSFGGKIDPTDACPAAAAVRELHEEANILVPLTKMQSGQVGKIHFTFDQEDDFEMIVHLFRVDLKDACVGKDQDERKTIELGIRGCEEITPIWIDDWRDIPLNQMFADDSIWLPMLLEKLEDEAHLQFDGFFHFVADPQNTNSVLDWFMNVK